MSYRIAVRSLCEFAAKQGDLDLRFTPSPTSQEGMAGHRRVSAGRDPGYQSEVPLAGEYGLLSVRGRADGYDPQRQRLEEVKTHRGDLARQPDNHRQLHWAQARVYAWLQCQQLGLPGLNVALVYLDVDTQRQTLLEEYWSAARLQAHFEQICQCFLHWAQAEVLRLQRRRQAMGGLQFPFAQMRGGQRLLAESVYKAARTGHCLMAQATTGIGKTLGTLFPLLKAMGGEPGLDKIYFLSAKSPGRALAMQALQQLRISETGQGLRCLELVARDKACEYPGRACHGDACPLARGFYDRLPAARQAAGAQPMLGQQSLRTIALAHQVCPYYLSQEMARWADVVVADYNYYFDVTALLYGLAQSNRWRVALLVDEAHNLVERGRSMYSAPLQQGVLLALCKQAASHPAHAELVKPLRSLARQWSGLVAQQALAYQAHAELPGAFMLALQRCVAAIGEHMNRHATHVDAACLTFYFQALHFQRIAERFDSDFLFDVTLQPSPGKGRRRPLGNLCLRNLVPARQLAPRWQQAHSSTLFSATLAPARYYADLLGLPPGAHWLDVPSPFRAQQLEVLIEPGISTRYKDRQASLAPIAELIAEQFHRRPGNYLAFFSSFEYLQQAQAQFARDHRHIAHWAQSAAMNEDQRQAFLEQFSEERQGIGFAVLGGAFSEGVDLPGKRLIGAFIATLGLPQLNPVNEQLKRRMGVLFGSGYDYTYLYPGLRKVVQAAGRVIRGDADQGVVILIDDRFAQPQVEALLPAWWSIGRRVTQLF